MEFQTSQPIFMQIVDHICDKILRQELTAGKQVPSVRELAVELEVNPNTVMRAIERLSAAEIIFNRRGVGYFVAEQAPEQVQTLRRQRLLEEQLPRIAEEMKLLNISVEEIAGTLRRLTT